MSDLNYFRRFKKETVYLYDKEDECYIKSDPSSGYFIKFPGSDEKPTKADSSIVVRAVHAKKEVSKKQYEEA